MATQFRKKLNSQLLNIFKSKGKFFTMALVDYSDWDDSDSESPPIQEPTSKKATTVPATDPKRIVDRGNPRKIRVNLDKKPIDDTAFDGVHNDVPARKRLRIGAGGGSGFNAMLPAPKKVKPQLSNNDTKSGGKDTTRRAFGLKTSAAPGFDRQEIGQDKMEEEQTDVAPAKSEDVKIKGNAMMFKPLSIARNTTKKKSKTASSVPPVTNCKSPDAAPPAAKPKPKTSLFGLSATEEPRFAEQPTKSTTYEPLVYNTERAPGPNLEPTDTQPVMPSSLSQRFSGQAETPSLQSIASDLNLSKSEMRQLLGRHGQQAPGSKVLTFDTEKEYQANADYLAEATDAELAAMKHNPVRAIAPGKHSLQQLVNAASNQRDALEESFASGKRNRKEAGSKYGW